MIALGIKGNEKEGVATQQDWKLATIKELAMTMYLLDVAKYQLIKRYIELTGVPENGVSK